MIKVYNPIIIKKTRYLFVFVAVLLYVVVLTAKSFEWTSNNKWPQLLLI